MSKKSTFHDQVNQLIEQIMPILAGQPPEVQGAVLADLMATYLAGYPEHIRANVTKLHLMTVAMLIPANYELYVRDQREAMEATKQ